MTDTLHQPPDVPEFPSPCIVDSRRLLGPNLYSAHPGVVLDVRLDDVDGDVCVGRWMSRVVELFQTLDWPAPDCVTRREDAGATLFVAAPVDVLMTATEANEQAWAAAESDVAMPDDVIARLRTAAGSEQGARPHLRSVRAAAIVGGVTVTFDDAMVTIGSGVGSRTWPLDQLPPADAIPWTTLGDCPVSIVTGSNGKTTTTRLVAAMWREAGRSTGWCCSDGVWVNDEQFEAGDYSGPAGARAVLRDNRVAAAVLETARGGILRRGLAVTRATAAIITNISPDHFGEYGIENEHELADVKAVVARVLGGDGTLVLNAGDSLLVELASRLDVRCAWFSAASHHPAVDAHVRAGGDAATVCGGRVMLHHATVWHDLGAVNDMPIALGGAAQHNVENMLGAALLGAVSGIPIDAIRATLARFGALAADNPGRLQVLRFGGLTVVVDYAHNPDGLAALCATAKMLPARRRLLLLGQAGNRDDEQLRALVRAALDVLTFDRVIIKELPTMLRGRRPGEVPRVLADELSRAGVSPGRVEVVTGELAAMQRAVAWARDGDLLVCPIHVEKQSVLDWLHGLALDQSWQLPAGE